MVGTSEGLKFSFRFEEESHFIETRIQCIELVYMNASSVYLKVGREIKLLKLEVKLKL